MAGAIFFFLWYALRSYRALADWQVLTTYGAAPWYLLLSGLVWAGGVLLWLVGAFRRWPHTPRAGILFSVLYYVWYWADRTWLQVSPSPNMVYSALLSSLLVMVYITGLLTSQAKDYFMKETE